MPEFPFRVQFTAEIDTSGGNQTMTGRNATLASSSLAVVEVNVHNVKTNTQTEEAPGTCACFL